MELLGNLLNLNHALITFWFQFHMDFPRMASDSEGQKVSDEVMKLLMTDSYKDIRIIANDGEIILCARSVYFNQMFSNINFIECDSGEVRFDCDKIIMERVIKYLYHGFEGIVEERVGEGIRYS